jgi:hypothetical protein
VRSGLDRGFPHVFGHDLRFVDIRGGRQGVTALSVVVASPGRTTRGVDARWSTAPFEVEFADEVDR